MYCQFLGGKKTIICTEHHLRLEKGLKKSIVQDQSCYL
jgi:hypothetical protein